MLVHHPLFHKPKPGALKQQMDSREQQKIQGCEAVEHHMKREHTACREASENKRKADNWDQIVKP
jgi:hypothetical protein